jgi:hypothetical protein
MAIAALVLLGTPDVGGDAVCPIALRPREEREGRLGSGLGETGVATIPARGGDIAGNGKSKGADGEHHCVMEKGPEPNHTSVQDLWQQTNETVGLLTRADMVKLARLRTGESYEVGPFTVRLGLRLDARCRWC